MINKNVELKNILSAMVVIEYFWLAVLLIFLQTVFADSFFPNGDVQQSNFLHTVAIAVDLPDSGEVIANSPSLLNGIKSQELGKKTFLDLVSNENGVYKRTSEQGLSIASIPGAKVSLYWFPYNQAGHLVEIGNSWLFLGPYQANDVSDITEIASKAYVNSSYIKNGILVTRGGISLKFDPLGKVFPSSEGGANTGREIYSTVIKQPIKILESIHECKVSKTGNKSALVSVVAQNIGTLQEKVQLGNGLVDTFDVAELKTLGPIEVTAADKIIQLSVQNSVKRCFTKNDGGPNNHAFIVTRNDLDHPWWGGLLGDIQSEIVDEELCITRIPYNIPIGLPGCLTPALVQLDQKNETINLVLGETKQIDVLLENSGEEESAEQELHVLVPTEIAQYIRINSSQDSIIKVPGLLGKQRVAVPLVVTILNTLQPIDLKTFEIQVIHNEEVKIVEVLVSYPQKAAAVKTATTPYKAHDPGVNKGTNIGNGKQQVLGTSKPDSKIVLPLGQKPAREVVYTRKYELIKWPYKVAFGCAAVLWALIVVRRV